MFKLPFNVNLFGASEIDDFKLVILSLKDDVGWLNIRMQ